MLSTKHHLEIVNEKLFKELDAGRLAGPFNSPPLPHFRVSPLGIVPKKTPGEYRMIHHLSFPHGTSVNDGIDSEYTRVHYARIDDAINCIKRCGQGAYLAKTDIKRAFRIVPIHPGDYHFLGMKWKEKYYFDKCMPMGCASSCKTFEAFSTAIEWITQEKLGIQNIIHLLDDFFICELSYQKCADGLKRFLSLCHHLGVPMAPEKTVGPSTVLTFAGIEHVCSTSSN